MAKDLNIKIKSDSKEAESGIKKVTSQLNTLSKDIKKSDVAKLAKSFTSVTAATAGAVTAIKKVNEAIKETTEAYKQQINVEKQLETAAKNNPFLTSQSVEQLKQFAYTLQRVTTTGDEELLTLMSQLASAGRTQTEIQEIMSAALDVSASGMMSLNAAVSALNKTYSGSVGLLGNQISGLKTLTTEQLKNGEAVRVVADRFKGMAEETAKATGAYEQMKNAQGDMLEEIGKFTKPTSDLWNNFWKGFYEKGAQVISDLNEKIENRSLVKIGKLSANNYIKALTADGGLSSVQAYKLEYARITKELDEDELTALNLYLKTLKNISGQELYLQEAVTKRLNTLKAIRNESEQTAADNAKKEAETADANKKAQDAIDAYKATVKKAEEELALREKLGEKITEEEKEQTLLNTRMTAYLKMIKDAEGTISGNKGFAKEQADLIGDAWGKQNKNKDFEKVKATVAQWQTEEKNQLEHQKAMLDIYEDYLRKKELKTSEEIALYKQVQEAQKNVNKAIEQEQKDHIAQTLSDINSYVTEFASITQSMTDMVSQANNRETENQMYALDKQYTQGLISYEEYEEKKKEIKKKAAEEQYKLDMWNWTASLLQATANVAEGVSKAIAQGGVAGIITGALVASSGAMQIATIQANKPQRFATGGIVPGSSYTGDRVQANVNSGEMILNAAQQAQLWNLANGRSGGGNISMPVTINNNSSANVSTKFNKNGLIVMIDEIVNSSMQSGKYTQSMNYVQNSQNGKAYL